MTGVSGRVCWVRTIVVLLIGYSLGTATGGQASPDWGESVLRHEPAWYASSEALATARSVIAYQSAAGGWPKNTNLAIPPTAAYRADHSSRTAPTIDNGAATLPIRFLARVAHAT